MRTTNIFLQSYSGESVAIDVALSDSVRKIKQKIHAKEGVPLDQIILSYEGRQLIESERTRVIPKNDSKASVRITNLYFAEYPSYMDDGEKYCILPHNAKYKVNVINPFNNVKCCVNVSIDGEDMGSWVLNAGQSCGFERPISCAKQFTFLRSKLVIDAEVGHKILSAVPNAILSSDLKHAVDTTVVGSGIEAGQDSNGLVEVKYTPEIAFDDIVKTLADNSINANATLTWVQ